MGLLDLFKPQKKGLLTEDDKEELRELERGAYKEEAKKLIVEKAKIQAQQDYIILNNTNKSKNGK